RAGDDRGRLRRAAAAEIPGVDLTRRVLRVDVRARDTQTLEVTARCDEVDAAGGAALGPGREVGDVIVGERRGVLRVRGADCDQVAVVGRVGERRRVVHVALEAGVAAGGD